MAQDTHLAYPGPDAVRAEIERTRARMSGTLDEIEDVLVRKKEHLRDRFDVVARIREQPLKAAGIVLGAGVLLGFMTGGGDDEETKRIAAEARAAHWEGRSRRLLAIARGQEELIDDLETDALDSTTGRGPTASWGDDDEDGDDYDDVGDDLDDDDEDEDDEDEDDDGDEDDDEDYEDDDREIVDAVGRRWRAGRSRISELKGEYSGRVADFVTEAARAVLDGIRKAR